MKGSKAYKAPMPKNGKKVNDWPTLRPYVEGAVHSAGENSSADAEKLWNSFGESTALPSERQ